MRILLAPLALLAACRSHLPDPDALDPSTEAEGRAIIAASVAALGGLPAWTALGDLRCDWEDRWTHPSMAPKFPEGVSNGTFLYNFDLDKGLLRFATTPEAIWGYDSVEGWRSVGGTRVYDDPKDPTFMLPTVAYFLGLPFKWMDAGLVVRAMEPIERDGERFDRVFIGFEGQGKPTDRYVAEFEPDTHLLRRTEFTVVDAASFVEAGAEYRAWQVVGDARIPAEMVAYGLRPMGGEMHSTTWRNCLSDPSFDRQQYEKPI